MPIVNFAVRAPAISWLAAQRHRFVPAPGSRLDPADTKPVTELALLLCYLRRQRLGGDPGDRAAVELLTRAVASVADRALSLLRPVTTPAETVFHAAMCGALSSPGQEPTRHRDLVNRAVRAGALEHTERLTHHIMEERLILDWCGIPHRLPSWTELVERSMLRHRLLAVRLTERTSYQLTHDIMFLTGFDRASADILGLLDCPNLRTVLSDLMVRFSSEAQWDLLGELLLCWDCLHLPEGDHVYREAWRLLLAQQSTDGSFRGPQPHDEAHEHTPTDAERFANRYHPTLVAILALTAHQRRADLASGIRPVQPLGRTDTERESSVTAARAATGWLGQQLARPPRPVTRPAVACGVLVGTWLCAAIDTEIHDSFSVIAERAADLLANADMATGMPPALALTVYALLRQQGLEVPALASFTQVVQFVLALHPPPTAEDDVWLCEKRVILHQLGLGPPAPRVSTEYAARLWLSLPLRADRDALQLAALAAESATSYGTIDPPRTRRSEVVARVILSQAGRLFRDRDLHTASMLLRAAHHLDPLSDDRVEEFTGELLLHQRTAGSYGLLDISDDVVTAGPGKPAIDPDADLHLPTTLSVLWTLAELLGNRRLYRSIATPISASDLAVTSPRR